MNETSNLVEAWKSGKLELKKADRLIALLVNENQQLKPIQPENNIGATHWATLPDGNIALYKIGRAVEIWLPYSKTWTTTDDAPYTIHPFKN